ncbi:Rap1 GTPase-activating protein 2 [Podila verticillata]|nr:Rap1 GTPase-activating protein 2 [Podila verticillata]
MGLSSESKLRRQASRRRDMQESVDSLSTIATHRQAVSEDSVRPALPSSPASGNRRGGERVNLYSHLGMQEMHYNSLNDFSDSITQQLHRNERPQPTILTAIPQISNSTSSPSMSSGSSGPTAKGSRLGKLGRFKLFPSLSMGSIHKSKSSTGTLTQPSSSAVSRDSHQMSTASADDSSQPGNISISPISPTLEESTGASLPDPDVDAEETESTRLGAAMSISGSASTFASVGTVNMMIAASSGSSSNSSISSNYNTFEVGFGRKPRQSLAVFLEQHKHMEGSGGTRQPSISSTVAPRTLTEGALNPASHDSAPMSGSKDRSNERESRRSIFGSERVTNGHGVFRSGILKRSSRRTVSASHISPSNIFAPVKGSDAPMATCSSGTHKTGRCNCGQAVKHFCSERDIQTAARLQALMAQDMDTEETGTDEGEGRVGRYLFGNELSNMSFGDSKEPDSQNQMSMEVLTSVPLEETTTLDDSSVTLEPVILNVASMAAPNLGKQPRSAVAEYTSSCSSIVYKKQRSMSLQDADLLTADQFIALMPDEITAKRRFSSEEKLATVLAPLSNGSVPSSTSTTTFSTTPPSSNSLSSEVSTTPESNRSERETAPSSNREQVQPKILIRVEATSDVEDGEHGQSDTAASNNEGRASDIPRHRTQPIAIKKPTMLQHATQEHGSLASSNMFPNFDQQDLVETIWILFDDLEQVVIKMLNILKKYIATDQFAKLLQESDEMGELSQQIFRAEMDRRERWIEQQLDQEIESKIGAHRTEDSVDDSNRSGAFNGQAREASSIHPTERPRRALHANDHLAQTSDQINGANRSGNGNHAEQGHSHLPLHFGDTKGTTTGITNRIRHRRSRDHVRVEPFCRPQDETVKDESSSLEGKQDIVRDYIRTLLEMAEISVAEYMRTYNRFLIVPTAGYRIEGCNDNKKIERAAAALSGLSRGRRSSLFMPSSTTSPPSLLQQSLLTKMSGRGYQEPTEVEGTDSSRTDASETRVSMTSMASQSSSDLALTQSQFGGGHAMVRVKSLPESKDEWAALQKRKEMGSGAGVGEAIAMGMAPTPSVTSGPSPIGIGGGAGGIGPIGAVGVGDMGGRILPSDLSMMGDYSKEHMGHEAVLRELKALVLTKLLRFVTEHRTFVGQVEGLGTVIISIIKDMVVPTEARQTIPVFRSNTGPGAISHSSTPTAFGAAISGPFNGVSAGHPRPELVHSAQSYYPGRGGQSFSPVGSITGRSGGLTATPRTSSEAMRDVDSLRITLPEPEPSPLNNLTRRTGKPQWKTILQSIHPAITQQVASKLKKVQNNQHFEKELATFDETMLRFNYKFGVLLVQPGQKHEEDWFGNQTGASARFQEFLESGTLGQKVALKGFERFSAGLDTRLGETGEHSYFDTWGDGFEIMYHVSTMLPFNTLDPQQIQRKRHIGNDIVCIVFVDGDQPFVPNAIKSQFLHIFVIVHPITLPDGTRGYSATIACDEQVPEFGPPLPDPPIFRNPVELRAFLLCKMINGENAAYKAPRLIKPHQRARSGLLENLVAKANTLAKDSSKKQKAHRLVLLRSAPAIVISPINTIASTSATITIIRLRAFPGFLLIRMDIQYATPPNRRPSARSTFQQEGQHTYWNENRNKKFTCPSWVRDSRISVQD